MNLSDMESYRYISMKLRVDTNRRIEYLTLLITGVCKKSIFLMQTAYFIPISIIYIFRGFKQIYVDLRENYIIFSVIG